MSHSEDLGTPTGKPGLTTYPPAVLPQTQDLSLSGKDDKTDRR